MQENLKKQGKDVDRKLLLKGSILGKDPTRKISKKVILKVEEKEDIASDSPVKKFERMK